MVQVQCDGILVQEIVLVQIVGWKGVVSDVCEDEYLCLEIMFEQLVKLKVLFCQGGVIIVGNVLGVNDGVVVLIIVSEQQVVIQGFMLWVCIVVMVMVGVELCLMGLGLVLVVCKVLEWVGFNINDMDLIELNEVFVVQVLGVFRQFGVLDDVVYVNFNGGVIVLGYLLGMSGVWLVLSVSFEL